nr:pectinesterase 2-like [Ipomoea batatas]
MASTLLLLSISLFPFIIHGANENHQLIQNTCKTINAYQFADYDFCVSTLQARPARECARLLRIGWTSIDLLGINVTDTRRHIRSVLKSGNVQHWARRCVIECYERYDTAEILVESCLRKYRHTDFVNADFYALEDYPQNSPMSSLENQAPINDISQESVTESSIFSAEADTLFFRWQAILQRMRDIDSIFGHGFVAIQNVREASKFTVQNYINRDSWNPMCSSGQYTLKPPLILQVLNPEMYEEIMCDDIHLFLVERLLGDSDVSEMLSAVTPSSEELSTLASISGIIMLAEALFEARKLLQSSTYDIVVAKDGSGRFRTVMEAVNAAHSGNDTHKFKIYIKQGIYEESVRVNMQYIMLVGDGIQKTVITGNKSVRDGTNTYYSSTVAVDGNGFMAKGITFTNTAGPENYQAVALSWGRMELTSNHCYRNAVLFAMREMPVVGGEWAAPVMRSFGGKPGRRKM